MFRRCYTRLGAYAVTVDYAIELTGLVVSPFGVRIKGTEISSIFGESNIAGVTGALRAFAYYLFLDPATSFAGRAVACVERVRVDQVPMFVATGYSSPPPVRPR